MLKNITVNALFSYQISHATLWASFDITKLLANLLTKLSVFFYYCANCIL